MTPEQRIVQLLLVMLVGELVSERGGSMENHHTNSVSNFANLQLMTQSSS